MSATCLHADVDAVHHPECAGCAALMGGVAERAEREHRQYQEQQRAAWSAPADPMEDIRRWAAVGPTPARSIADSGRRAWPASSSFGTPAARSLLDLTGDEAAERSAMQQPERPGTWFGDEGADGRQLTQEQTDILVRRELRMLPCSLTAERTELAGILGAEQSLDLDTGGTFVCTSQRGGIDSDPLVRLLAWRAWGERDLCWFEERGVRAGDAVVIVETQPPPLIAHARDISVSHGETLESGHPGQLVRARIDMSRVTAPVRVAGRSMLFQSGIIEIMCRVSDRERRDNRAVPSGPDLQSVVEHACDRAMQTLRGEGRMLTDDARGWTELTRLMEEELRTPVEWVQDAHDRVVRRATLRIGERGAARDVTVGYR